MSETIYLMGDVHGCYKTLIELVNKLPRNVKLCFVGDLIDRGSNSKEVIEFVKSNPLNKAGKYFYQLIHHF